MKRCCLVLMPCLVLLNAAWAPGAPGAPDPATSAPAPAPNPAAAAEAAPAGPVVTLLERGAEPRRLLRLSIKPGQSQSMDMTLQMSMTQTVGGVATPSPPVPGMRFRMDTTASEVRDNGDITLKFTYTECEVMDTPGVQPMVMSSMKDALASMVGLNGRCEINNRGLTKEATIDVPANANPMIRQQVDGLKRSLHQMCAPLPEEAVGVGARWTVDSTMKNNSITFKQSATYTLASLAADRAELNIAMSQTAEPQTIQTPMGPVQLDSLKTDGKGSTAMILTQLVPEKAVTDTATDIQMTLNMNGKAQQLTQSMRMALNIKSAPAGAPATGNTLKAPSNGER